MKPATATVQCPKCGEVFTGIIRDGKYWYLPQYVTCRKPGGKACCFISLEGPTAPPNPKNWFPGQKRKRAKHGRKG